MEKVLYRQSEDKIIAFLEKANISGSWDTIDEAYEDLLINYINYE